MQRRHLISAASAFMTASMLLAGSDAQEMEVDGRSLVVRHQSGRLFCTFMAPTTGWVAAGFNDTRHLEGTRFVMGAINRDTFHFEEHIAQVLGHMKVEDLGLVVAVCDVSIDFVTNATTLHFALPIHFTDTDRTLL